MNGTRALSAASLFLLVDLLGTFVFAVEGAMAGINANLDFLGLMVLSFITAVGGGIIRDLLIGAVPPGAIRDWRYAVVAFAGGASVFFFHQFLMHVPGALIVTLDAAGLSLFAVSGAGKALEFRIHPFLAILMGGITGVGGGTVRDVLLTHIPTVLRADIYASAALLGSAIVVLGLSFRLPRPATMIVGAIACFTLRLLSVSHGWSLPHQSR